MCRGFKSLLRYQGIPPTGWVRPTIEPDRPAHPPSSAQAHCVDDDFVDEIPDRSELGRFHVLATPKGGLQALEEVDLMRGVVPLRLRRRRQPGASPRARSVQP